ncbi:hypothetical protein GH714_000953 [Hevea brasiliensis]|uniref:Ubiquitin-like domain-containing protein n=1 Tax=Hevea brasiliensis TaxID=3981 RepID=A0A6A6LWV4_HEVBR|nr:hypothetical protein GH714_000953 [Hevea brasiliensis]
MVHEGSEISLIRYLDITLKYEGLGGLQWLISGLTTVLQDKANVGYYPDAEIIVVKRYPVIFPKDPTIYDINLEIRDLINVAVEDQELFFNGKHLQDEVKAEDYRIQPYNEIISPCGLYSTYNALQLLTLQICLISNHD